MCIILFCILTRALRRKKCLTLAVGILQQDFFLFFLHFFATNITYIIFIQSEPKFLQTVNWEECRDTVKIQTQALVGLFRTYRVKTVSTDEDLRRGFGTLFYEEQCYYVRGSCCKGRQFHRFFPSSPWCRIKESVPEDHYECMDMKIQAQQEEGQFFILCEKYHRKRPGIRAYDNHLLLYRCSSCHSFL